MATAVGTMAAGGRGAAVLLVNPKLALTPDKENEESEEGSERSSLAFGRDSWTEVGGAGQGVREQESEKMCIGWRVRC